MEKWIIQNAEEVNIDMTDFGLPNDFDELKRYSKSVKTKKDERFRRLFKALKNQNATGVQCLSSWITYLKSHPYDADLNFFRRGSF